VYRHKSVATCEEYYSNTVIKMLLTEKGTVAEVSFIEEILNRNVNQSAIHCITACLTQPLEEITEHTMFYTRAGHRALCYEVSSFSRLQYDTVKNTLCDGIISYHHHHDDCIKQCVYNPISCEFLKLLKD
jgi:hypothetical protein